MELINIFSLFICIVVYLTSTCEGKSASEITFSLKRKTGNKRIKSMKYRKDRDSKLNNALFESSNIYGNSSHLNYFYINALIGTPGQKTSLIIDTGSSLTGVPCEGICKKCGKHINEYFKPSKSYSNTPVLCTDDICARSLSKTFCDAKLNCVYNMNYAEGSSYSGFLKQDFFFLKDGGKTFKSFKIPLGCHSKESNQLMSQDADGILGLSPINNSTNPFIENFSASNEFKPKIFSICLGINGGFFTIGGINATLHHLNANSLFFTKLYSVESTYRVLINNIHFKGKEYNISESNYYGVIDTASTSTYFPITIYENLIHYFNIFCSEIENCLADNLIDGLDNKYCFKVSKKVSFKQFLNSLPVIMVKLGKKGKMEKEFHWLPKNYITERISNENGKENIFYCLGFSGKNVNEIILGATFLLNHDVIFDIDKNKLGIASARCTEEKSEQKYLHYNQIQVEKSQYAIYKLETKEELNKQLLLLAAYTVLLCLCVFTLRFIKVKNKMCLFLCFLNDKDATSMREKLQNTEAEMNRVIEDLRSN